MIYRSRIPNHDPEPWVVFGDGWEQRLASKDDNESKHMATWDPRVEFDDTKDPMAWYDSKLRTRFNTQIHRDPDLIWAPRRIVYDAPANTALVTFRKFIARNNMPLARTAAEWVRTPMNNFAFGIDYFTADEMDHAMKVLSRIASVYKDGSSGL